MTARARGGGGLLARFDKVERAVHWTNAFLFAVLVLTGAALYLTPLIAFVGRRDSSSASIYTPVSRCLSRSSSPSPVAGARPCDATSGA